VPLNAVAYAYRNTRAQFHPALYVVLYAGMFTALYAAALWEISLVMSPTMSLNWEVIGAIVGPLAMGELARGHVRLWLHRPLDKWSAIASAAGGAVAGLTLWGIMVAKWGIEDWYDVFACAVFGASSFLVLGWLIQYQVRRSVENH
jgi:hypothetical protein